VVSTGTQSEVPTVTVGRLYLMMGRELVPIDRAGPGNIVAIAGLGAPLST